LIDQSETKNICPGGERETTQSRFDNCTTP
jgi:hypothetical protein